jgi:hypothetical protein
MCCHTPRDQEIVLDSGDKKVCRVCSIFVGENTIFLFNRNHGFKESGLKIAALFLFVVVQHIDARWSLLYKIGNK